MIKVREAKRKDLDEIVKLNSKLIKYENRIDKQIKILGKKELLKYNLKHMRSKKSKIFVAEEDRKIVGYLMGYIQKMPDIFKTKETGYLCDAFVLPKYRRRGVMKRLYKEFLKWLKKKKIRYVYLHSFVKNPLGLKTWKSLGFKPNSFSMRKKI